MSSGHASLNASSAHRWMACPGSVKLVSELPPEIRDVESEYAREGTAAHKIAAHCLLHGGDMLANMSGITCIEIDGYDVDKEMADAVLVYLGKCVPFTVRDTAQHWVELKLNLQKLNPPAPMYGTADFVAFDRKALILDIVDLKYGRGVLVEVFENEQLLYYALGAVLAIEKEIRPDIIQRVRMTIVQPRAEHPDGPIRTCEITYEDLVAFAVRLKQCAEEACSSAAQLIPGEHCRWCPAAAVCSARARQSVEIARSEFDVGTDISPPDIQLLSIEETSWLLTQLPALETWISQLRQHVTRVLENGGAVPGFKLVARRATRKWKDEGMLLSWADDMSIGDSDLYEERKVRSVAQLEKRIGKKVIPADLIEKKSSGVTLAPESDVRPNAIPASDFEALPPTQESNS